GLWFWHLQRLGAARAFGTAMGKIPRDGPGRRAGDEEALGQIGCPDSAGRRERQRAFGRATPRPSKKARGRRGSNLRHSLRMGATSAGCGTNSWVKSGSTKGASGLNVR